MQTENNFFAEIKRVYRTGGMTTKLIFVNVIVFLSIQLAYFILNKVPNIAPENVLYPIFSLFTPLKLFIYQPWGLVTSIFSHFDFMHLLWNMVFLYVGGRAFEQFFSQSRLFYTYLLGGIFGGLFEMISHLILPSDFSGANVVGASGSIMAILVAVSFYNFKYKISLFGLFDIQLIYIVLFFIIRDLLKIGANDGTAHFAHLGGAALGMLSIQNMYSYSNIITRFEKFGGRITHFFSVLFKPSKTPKMKVTPGNKHERTRQQSDEQYNYEKKKRQEQIDTILDKIAKSGYDSLTKAEKEFLFNQSNNG